MTKTIDIEINDIGLEQSLEKTNPEITNKIKKAVSKKNFDCLATIISKLDETIVLNWDEKIKKDMHGEGQLMIRDYSLNLSESHIYKNDPIRGCRLRILSYYVLRTKQTE
jgi:hypothetical protein